MKLTRRNFIKGLGAAAAVLGLPVKALAESRNGYSIADLESGPKRVGNEITFEDESPDLLDGLVSWYQPGRIWDVRIYNRALTEKEVTIALSRPYDLYVDWSKEKEL